MKKFYILRSYQTEINDKNFNYTEGCTEKYDIIKKGCSIDYEEIYKTENKQDAMQELEKYTSIVKQNSFASNVWEVTEYFVDEEDYDEDGDELIFGDLCGRTFAKHIVSE